LFLWVLKENKYLSKKKRTKLENKRKEKRKEKEKEVLYGYINV